MERNFYSDEYINEIFQQVSNEDFFEALYPLDIAYLFNNRIDDFQMLAVEVASRIHNHVLNDNDRVYKMNQKDFILYKNVYFDSLAKGYENILLTYKSKGISLSDIDLPEDLSCNLYDLQSGDGAYILEGTDRNGYKYKIYYYTVDKNSKSYDSQKFSYNEFGDVVKIDHNVTNENGETTTNYSQREQFTYLYADNHQKLCGVVIPQQGDTCVQLCYDGNGNFAESYKIPRTIAMVLRNCFNEQLNEANENGKFHTADEAFDLLWDRTIGNVTGVTSEMLNA